MESIWHWLLGIFLKNPLGQSIGFFALLLNAIAFATSKDRKFLIFMAISSAIWGMHFALMGMRAWAAVSFLDIFKNLLALYYPKHRLVFFSLLMLYLVSGILSFETGNRLSILPSINAILALIFVFYLKGKQLKIWFLFILALRFIYNRWGNSIGGMLSDISLFCSGIYGLWKLVRWK